jgi:hypothetical protein
MARTPSLPSARAATINPASVGATMMMPPLPVYQGNQPMINVSAKKMGIGYCFIRDFIIVFPFL